MKVYLSRKKAKKCQDLYEARRIVILHLDKTGRGTRRGNRFHGGRVEDDEGKHIATVAVNGIVWPAESWSPATKPIIDERGNRVA